MTGYMAKEKLGIMVGVIASITYIHKYSLLKEDLKELQTENNKVKTEQLELQSKYNNFQSYHLDQITSIKPKVDTIFLTKYKTNTIEDKHKIDSLSNMITVLESDKDSLENKIGDNNVYAAGLITKYRGHIYSLKQDSIESQIENNYQRRLLNVFAISRRSLKAKNFDKLTIPDSVDTPLPYNKHNTRKIRNMNGLYR